MKKINFRWYQEEAIKKFKNTQKGALFMDTGVGKTFTALEIMKDEKILVIAPAQKVKSRDWQNDAKTYYGKEIVIYSFEKLRQRNKKRPTMDYINKLILHKEITGLIIDECHRAKSHTNKEDSRNTRFLSKKIPKVLGLTASYAPNNYLETWYMLLNLDVKCIPAITKTDEFIVTFYNYLIVKTPYGSVKKPTTLKQSKKKELFSYFENYVYFYMPEKMTHTIDFQTIDKPLPKKYLEIEDAVTEDDTLSIFEKLNTLQQIANGFEHTYNFIEEGDKLIKKVSGYTVYDTYKLDVLKEIVFTAWKSTDDSLIIVYKYIADLEQIKELLDSFIDNWKTFILLRQANQSEGLNLQEYNHMIFYSPTFSYKDFEQMKGRIMRIGQLKTPKFTLLCRKNTVEEHIYNVLQKKGTASDLYAKFMENKEK